MPTKKRARREREQPHDAVFKTYFSDAKIARSYLLHYTPAAVHEWVDFSFFRKSDTAFVSGRFGISFSDIVYETRLRSGAAARLLFLFEHKSYVPNSPVQLQLLDYLLQIWEDDLKNKRPLSVVIPIVVYHGERGWEQKTLQEYFPGLPEDWSVFIPNFHYLLTDLGNISQTTIQAKGETEYLRNLFLAFKYCRDEALVRKNWNKIFTFGVQFDEDDRERILFQTLTIYIVNLFDMAYSEIKDLSKDIPDPEHSWLDAIPDVLGEKWRKKFMREGRAEGRALGLAEGREEGRKEGLITVARNLIQKFPDWSDEQIAELTGAKPEQLRDIRAALKSTE